MCKYTRQVHNYINCTFHLFLQSIYAMIMLIVMTKRNLDTCTLHNSISTDAETQILIYTESHHCFQLWSMRRRGTSAATAQVTNSGPPLQMATRVCGMKQRG